MKRILMILTALILSFSLIGPIVADAKGASGGGARGGGSSFSSSKSSSSVSKPSTSSKATKADKTSKAAKQPAAAAKPANVSRAQVNSFKYKSKFSTAYVKPKNTVTIKKYESKTYYSKDNGFATTLMTAAGTYLVLDALLDDDEPVYIDSETGEPVDVDDLEDVQPVDTENETGDELPAWAVVLMVAMAVFALMALIIFIT